MLAYDWNFLGLSLEAKPMTGEKVVDGSTFYECDTCDFYIFYQNKWYKQTLVTEDGINVCLYKSLMKKMFGKLFDGNITKSKIIKPDTGTNIEFTTSLPAQIIDLTGYGDSTQQTYTGRNLLYTPNGSFLSNQVTWTSDNNTVTASGTAGSTSYSALTAFLPKTIPAGTYTFSIKEPVTKRIQFACRKDSSSPQVTNFIPIGSTSVTFTLEEDMGEYHVVCLDAANADFTGFTISAMQLEVGSEATSFEPYVGGPSPNPEYPQDVHTVTGEQTVMVSGKNLWKPAPDGTKIQGGITSVCENGVITLTGTATSGAAGTSPFYDLDAPLPAGTYTYSVKNALPYRIEFVMQDSSGTNHFPRIEANSKSGTITTTWETVKIRNGISGYTSGTEINAVIEELQLEVGSAATEFQPYQIQSYTVDLGTTELCKIGDYQDYIYKSGDDWYLHKVCGKYTFTGSENWVSSAYGTNSWNLSNLLNFPFDSNKVQIMSEVFRGIAAKDRGTAGNNLIYTASNVLFEIRNTTLTTLAGVQSATSGTPIYYALATPTDTQITDASLISQLNALLKYTFPAGVNNIIITADDLPMPLKLIISEKE